jgi:hypothetical protein
MKVMLSCPISIKAFSEKWEEEQKGPPVVFKYDGDPTKSIEIRNTFSPTTSWDMDSLHRTIQIAIHRVNPGCSLSWE